MKKKLILLSFGLIMAIMCACGKKEEDVEMVDTNNITDNSSISEEEINKFATGIFTEDSKEEIENATTTSNETLEEKKAEVAEKSAPELNSEIEERCPNNYASKRSNVTYGTFTHATYFSETCQMERGYSILLPANYSEDKKYPVLYLLHGIFGNEYSFSGDSSNKIKEIVGNMAADGYIEETIVVCPNMYATSDPNQQPGFTAEACAPYDNFINDLVNDLMPCIESSYSVLTGRENTYLAGFSMGGRETIYITLLRPELFGYVCAISAAPGIVATTDMFMTHPGCMLESEMKFAENAVEPNIFMLCCGTKDSVVGTYPKQYHEILEKNGSNHIWYTISGADHDNNAIKSGLYNLFKQIAYDKANK